MDPLTLTLSILVSILCGVTVYLGEQLSFQYDEEEDDEEEYELGDEYSSPEYSTAILDYVRKTVEEWMVLRFIEWNERYVFEKSNLTSFKNLYEEILSDFFKVYLNEDAINYDYTLFTRTFLEQYVVKIAANCLNRLIKRKVAEVEE